MGVTQDSAQQTLTKDRVDEILGESVLRTTNEFEHTLTSLPNGPSLDHLKSAEKLIKQAQGAMEAWYQAEYGKNFDRYNLVDEEKQAVLGFFRTHSSFKEALAQLGITDQQANDISLPWWNEISLLEQSYKIDAGGKISSIMQPSHSYITQLKRKGLIESTMSTMSVSGLLQTKVDDSGKSFIVLGVRAGLTLPNTFHLMPIGGAKFDERFESGGFSFKDLLTETELLEEYGKINKETKITPLCRALDVALVKPPGDVNYCFSVKLDLTKEQVEKHWAKNTHEDAKEHSELVFIEDSRDSILGFIRDNYRGITKNDPNRSLENAELLHPAALALAAHAGISLEELKGVISRSSSTD